MKGNNNLGVSAETQTERHHTCQTYHNNQRKYLIRSFL